MGLRWLGDSRRELGRFAQIEWQKKNIQGVNLKIDPLFLQLSVRFTLGYNRPSVGKGLFFQARSGCQILAFVWFWKWPFFGQIGPKGGPRGVMGGGAVANLNLK